MSHSRPSNRSFQNGGHRCPMRFSILSLLSYLPGCEDLAHLSAGGNCTYTSRTTAQSFLEAFSDVIEEELLQQLKGSSYLSLLIDESTDLTRLCSKENFGELFGLPSISAGVPSPPIWSPELINYLFN